MTVNTFHKFIVVAVLTSFAASEQGFEIADYIFKENVIPSGQEILQDVPAVTKKEACMVQCTVKYNCDGAIYHHRTKMCSLLKTGTTPTMIDKQGYHYFKKITKKNPPTSQAAQESTTASQASTTATQEVTTATQESTTAASPTTTLATGPTFSCKTLYDSGSTSNIYPTPFKDSSGNTISVFCRMDWPGGCGAGGWTMVMQIDGSKNTFGYTSAYWTNKQSFQTTVLGRVQETKLPTYWATPFTKICISMVNSAGDTRYLVIPKTANSMYDLLSGGMVQTSIGINTWKNVYSPQVLQDGCQIEGFNVLNTNSPGTKARIGVIADNQYACPNPISNLGLGLAGGWAGASTTASCGSFSAVSAGTPTWCYLYVQ